MKTDLNDPAHVVRKSLSDALLRSYPRIRVDAKENAAATAALADVLGALLGGMVLKTEREPGRTADDTLKNAMDVVRERVLYTATTAMRSMEKRGADLNDVRLGDVLRTEPMKCLACDTMLSAARPAKIHDDADKDIAITICKYCSHVMAFNPDMTLRELNDAEIVELAGDKDFLDVQAQVKAQRDTEADPEYQKRYEELKARYEDDPRIEKLIQFIIRLFPDMQADMDERNFAITQLALNVGSLVGFTIFEQGVSEGMNLISETMEVVAKQAMGQAEEMQNEATRRMAANVGPRS